ncbi:hypothetical protein WT83_27460 [Burkholderia territorii]|uniref:Uncharacterized protein n=1 Tax=Burkholderia territorii TaxID=1503055 RepID=A0A106DR67_9BURK|nr:hypothetical protein [Burkholderia territorii]KVV40906.1 hypothetical protein WT27_13350 [Burkholderia territorii]KVX33853.1 hypothetical protein WT31_09250 [Burkholderia territorii]KWN06422.1 hypothetical protein WT83_27460 [Burkholderia territorii]
MALHAKNDAVVFDVHTATHTLDVIGIPFEHAGELFAVHRPVHHSPFNARFIVSHVESGLAVPGVQRDTIDAARDAAIAFLDTNAHAFRECLQQMAKKPSARRTVACGSVQ